MIAMAVRNQDMGDALAARSFGDGGKMRRVRGARVDDRNPAAADQVSVGAEKGVGRRIVGDDAANLRRHFLGNAVVDLDASIEGKLCRHGLVIGFWTTRPILAKRDTDGSAVRTQS